MAVQEHRSTTLMRAAKFESHSGPIPRPSDLEHYNNIHPGLADRIMTMAETQAAHRQNLETKVVDAGINSQAKGQILAFILAFTAIVGGTTLALFDKPTAGLITILTTLATYTGVFVYGKKKQSKELSEKREE